MDWIFADDIRNANNHVYRMEAREKLVKENIKKSARPLALSSWQDVRHRISSQPRDPLERR